MSEGGGPKFRIERIKAPTSGDQKEIHDMHSVLTPHSTMERVLAGAGRDEALDLREMEGVFEAKNVEGNVIAALTLERAEDGWVIRHLQATTHDETVLAALIDEALAFAKTRGGSELRIDVSDRTDLRPILHARDFEEISVRDTRTYRRFL